MSMPALDGNILVLSSLDLLTFDTAATVGLTVISGPGALISAAVSHPCQRTRLLAALVACIVATLAVLAAALLGRAALDFLNLTVLRLFAGAAIVLIGARVAGFDDTIPSYLPLAVILIGILLSWRLS